MKPFLIAFFAALAFTGIVSAQDTRFTCTQFIGYSQAWNTAYGGWGPYAAQTMVNGGVDRVEARWQNGGAAYRWADPTWYGWNATGTDPVVALPVSPCASNANTPDRVILDVTHNEYLTIARYPSGPGAYIEGVIRNAVATIKIKYPSAVVWLQPVLGSPTHTGTCAAPNLVNHDPSDPNLVRASYNHPIIWDAIQRVAANTPGVVVGYDAHVRACSDYNDWEGHLVSGASSPIGVTIGTYYRDLRATPSPSVTVTPTATNTLTSTATPTPSATPSPEPTATATLEPTVMATLEPTVGPQATEQPTSIPQCFDTVMVNNSIITFINEVPC